MLKIKPRYFSQVFSKYRYFGIVLIVLFHIIKIVTAITQITAERDDSIFLNHSSDLVVKSSEIQNRKFNEIFKYGEQCENCTRTKRTIDRILHRQKRYLLFPMGSAIVVTMAGVKALTFNTPRGYNYLAEVDFYYPLPDKIYRPHHRTTTTTTEAPTTMPPEMFDHHHPDYHDHLITGWDHDHHDDIFMPSGGWKDDIFKNINMGDSSMDANTMNAANSSRRYWNENLSYHNSYNNLRPPVLQPMSRRRFDTISSTQVKTPVYYRGKRSTQNIVVDKKKKFEDYNDWADRKSHRDRRDLYSQIESTFKYKGIHIRTCILRAICESKHFLLPKGRSLFHDIFRILFTIPTKTELNDDYSDSSRNHDDSENCWKLYENECPISILQILLKSQKIF